METSKHIHHSITIAFAGLSACVLAIFEDWISACITIVILGGIALFIQTVLKTFRKSQLSVIVTDSELPHTREKYGVEDFRDAFANNEFVFFVQPIFNTQTKKFERGEALLRWEKDGELIPPLKFVDALEANLTYPDIAKALVALQEKTVEQFSKTDMSDISFNFNINTLHETTVPDLLLTQMKPHLATGTNVTIEIIENTINSYDKSEVVIDVMAKMKANGFKFSMDDFGKMHSNFARFLYYDFDVVKLDKEKVDSISSTDENEEDLLEICAFIKKLADKKGRITIAEGIENQYQSDKLNDIGIIHQQGFFFSKPQRLTSK